MTNKDPNYIIALGASAGALEEINLFFEHTPLDGVAYVIVQHLSADFRSRMVEVVSKHSRLLVVEAAHGMKLRKNVVYLIPNDKFMTIGDNTLYLTDKGKFKGPHLTINTFFNSLAKSEGKKAIGVIFSGLGSDGSEGIKAIKQAGGMTIAQNPDSAEFASMPSHAIATDMIDFILETQFMPQAIESYVAHNEELEAGDRADEKTIFEIIDHIHENLPFDFTEYKTTTILRRTKRRAASLNFFSLGDYFGYLKTNPDEVKSLAKDFLISVTSFFRDAEAFQIIEQTVLPQLLKDLGPTEEIKIWIAGCATGEEAYSIAILLKELLGAQRSERVVKIFATDIDTGALTYASKGEYPADRIAGISPERLGTYFDKAGNNYTVKSDIRKMMIFAPHDLVKNPPYCNMHFISCRNLLIYMTPVLQKKVYDMLLFGLRTNGFLFLGSSENPLTIIDNLQVLNKKWRIYKNLKNKRAVNFDTFALPEIASLRPSAAIKNDLAHNTGNGLLADNVNAVLARQLGYLAVCVDEHNTVVKSYGNTSKYLIAQNFNTNLVELLPRALAIAYNALSKQALRDDAAANVKAVTVKHNGEVLRVNLSVTPLLLDGGRQKGLVVVFNDDSALALGAEAVPLFNESEYNSKYTESLELELRETKEALKELHQKLDVSNEHLQSFNEELISANEEMQSANEEMQSVNEELHTINADYQLKNKELLEINDDLNNYFRSNVNGQLFVDNELRLMKFSPGAMKHINLLETDVGRPINHISTNIKFETIVDDARLVLEKGVVITKEIESNTGKWYQVMIMPAINSSNRNSGAIITFNDIDDLKNAQFELNKKNLSLTRINNDLDHFIHAASHDLLAPLGHIESSIEMLNDLVIEDANLCDILTIINSSVKRFKGLIADISVIAKVESDMLPGEKISLDDIIDNIEWSLKDKIAVADAKITRNLEVGEVLFSKKNMRSILYNLIANAIKFRSEQPPHIVVSTVREVNYIILTIEDNGKGISEDGLSRIFDMYGRLHQDIEGSGIGLYLAKKIINAAGGNIVVESEVGKGTKFVIYLNREAFDKI